jgi:hypothetical protein
LTDREKGILAAFSLKAGEYRKNALNGYSNEEIEACVTAGWLKRTKVGISITTEGKNARNQKT